MGVSRGSQTLFNGVCRPGTTFSIYFFPLQTVEWLRVFLLKVSIRVPCAADHHCPMIYT